MSYSLYCGDCLEEMRNIPSKSVDLILCDLPYGFTDCEWDKIIPFEPLWKEYKRVLKIRGIVVLFGNQPFTSSIINSNLSDYSHMWYWERITQPEVCSQSNSLYDALKTLLFSSAMMYTITTLICIKV